MSKYISILELAEILAVSVSTIRNWIKDGVIDRSCYFRVANTYRFSTELVLSQLHDYDETADNVCKPQIKISDAEVSPMEQDEKFTVLKGDYQLLVSELIDLVMRESAEKQELIYELKKLNIGLKGNRSDYNKISIASDLHYSLGETDLELKYQNTYKRLLKNLIQVKQIIAEIFGKHGTDLIKVERIVNSINELKTFSDVFEYVRLAKEQRKELISEGQHFVEKLAKHFGNKGDDLEVIIHDYDGCDSVEIVAEILGIDGMQRFNNEIMTLRKDLLQDSIAKLR